MVLEPPRRDARRPVGLGWVVDGREVGQARDFNELLPPRVELLMINEGFGYLVEIHLGRGHARQTDLGSVCTPFTNPQIHRIVVCRS